ncbi:MAG: hypothetical protein O7D30_05790, partial [Rickettsia endosymbiont of Ixodes persulcatus]|nr:hypothetical protein [Rickettsia endosymbiont of Ixodes persulcatus]
CHTKKKGQKRKKQQPTYQMEGWQQTRWPVPASRILFARARAVADATASAQPRYICMHNKHKTHISLRLKQ